jgi:hypothetical protein
MMADPERGLKALEMGRKLRPRRRGVNHFIDRPRADLPEIVARQRPVEYRQMLSNA